MFVKTPTAEKPHRVAHRSGPVVWTTCGQIIDLGRTSVMFVKEVDTESRCGICRMKEERQDANNSQ